MKKTTKFLSIILSMVLILTALPLIRTNLFSIANAKTISQYKSGDIIDFGSYPQSKITDENLLTELNSLDFNWISYDYYIGTDNCWDDGWQDGSMYPNDYMKYADVTYNGSQYRAVTFSQYRPYNTGLTSSLDNTHQNDNGYYPNKIYWFKYEPLRWRVLDPEEGFVLCESIIDSQPYNSTIFRNNSEYYQDKTCKDYANDYATSWIRTWLNNNFYNTAFTNVEKGKIEYSVQDNNCSWNDSYSGETTHDKIFLLSYDEVIQSKYNFSSDPYRDTTRCAQGTDYAKVQGLYVNSSSNVEDSCWWLRYSGIPSYYAYIVDDFGEVLDGGYTIHVNFTNIGVRPALKINLGSNILNEAEYNYTFNIQTPSRTEIRNKDGIILHTVVEGNVPNGSYVKWESSNGNFDKSADGSNLKIIAKNKGYTTFTAIICDADGNELARDSVEIYSKSGFFDKIGGFFRSLFGTTKIYEN